MLPRYPCGVLSTWANWRTTQAGIKHCPLTKMINLTELANSYSNDGHSIFGPSSSSMWLTCAGSLIPNIVAEDLGSDEAAYGTVAHEYTEIWLKTGSEPRHLIGTKQFVPAGWWGRFVNVTEEMAEYAKQCRDRCALLPGQHFTEQRVDFSHLTPIPNQGGTLDFAAVDGDTIYVVDHKFGKVVRVYAKKNSQLMIYAIGLVKKLQSSASRIVIRINQPLLDHFDEWECSRDELMEFAGFVRERAKAAWRLDAPRTPDPKACQWCKVKSTCAANVQMQMRMMAAETDEAFGEQDSAEIALFCEQLASGQFEPVTVDPLTLTTEHLAALWPFKGMVEKWWKAAMHELLRRAVEGADVPGLKPVEGRSNRRFNDRALAQLVAAGIPRSALATESVASPSEVEKIARKHGFERKDIPNLFDGIVEKPPGKPTLAPIADKRPALVNLSGVDWDADESEDE